MSCNHLLDTLIGKVEEFEIASNRMFDLSDRKLQEGELDSGIRTMTSAMNIQNKAVRTAENALIVSNKKKIDSRATTHKPTFAHVQSSREDKLQEKLYIILRNSDIMFELSEELFEDKDEIDNAIKLLDIAFNIQARFIKTSEIADTILRKRENGIDAKTSSNACSTSRPPSAFPINTSTIISLAESPRSSVALEGSSGIPYYSRSEMARKLNGESTSKRSRMTPQITEDTIESVLKRVVSNPRTQSLDISRHLPQATQQSPTNVPNVISRQPNNGAAHSARPSLPNPQQVPPVYHLNRTDHSMPVVLPSPDLVTTATYIKAVRERCQINTTQNVLVPQAAPEDSVQQQQITKNLKIAKNGLPPSRSQNGAAKSAKPVDQQPEELTQPKLRNLRKRNQPEDS